MFVEEFLIGKWDVIIVINMFLNFYMIVVVLLMMCEVGWGWIVNIVLVYGFIVLFYKFVYVIVKYGVIGLIKIIGFEIVCEVIICNVICFGYVLMLLVEV